MDNLRYTVMLHGFTNLDWKNNPCRESGLEVYSQEHCDFDDPTCDGWNVWLRRDWDTPNDNGETFDSDDDWDADFNSIEAARTYAVALQQLFDCDMDEY